MTDDEFILFDRLQKIKSVLKQYGEENFSISFSGGKDSTVLSALVDMAAPDNKIPRVYSDTGIELNMVRDFVYDLQEHDDRICIIKPKVPIKPMLEKDGYPFKSKYHSMMVYAWWHKEKHAWARSYYECTNVWRERNCPKMLLYQFEQKPDFEISSFCCNRLKKEPINKWNKESGRPYTMVGIMASEGGNARQPSAWCFTRKTSGIFNRWHHSTKSGRTGSLNLTISTSATFTNHRITSHGPDARDVRSFRIYSKNWTYSESIFPPSADNARRSGRRCTQNIGG